MNNNFAHTGKLALVLVLVFCILCTSAAQAPAGTQSVPSDESKIFLGTADSNGATGSVERESESGVWILLRIIIVLALVCAAIYGVVYLMKRSTRINVANDPYLKSVAQLHLAPNKSLQVITVGAKAFLVGITEQAISLVGEIDDRELIDAMNLASERNAVAAPASFASILSSFLPAQNRASGTQKGNEAGERVRAGNTDSGTGIQEAEAAAGTADFIRRQRERLRGIGSEQPGIGENDAGRQE